MKIFPVIHHRDFATSMEQVVLARECGADGAFLISHDGRDDDVLTSAIFAKTTNPGFPIGVNLLSRPPLEVCEEAVNWDLPMVWADSMGVDSRGLTHQGRLLSEFAAANPGIALFASVAFKYQPVDPDPAQAARHAWQAGFVPTTSGDATGIAPSLSKIARMSLSCSGKLAVASGMTPENIGAYAPMLSSVLVSTGIAADEHCIDRDKLKRLIESARGALVRKAEAQAARV